MHALKRHKEVTLPIPIYAVSSIFTSLTQASTTHSSDMSTIDSSTVPDIESSEQSNESLNRAVEHSKMLGKGNWLSCVDCDRKFKSKAGLRFHKLNVHTPYSNDVIIQSQ